MVEYAFAQHGARLGHFLGGVSRHLRLGTRLGEQRVAQAQARGAQPVVHEDASRLAHLYVLRA